MERGLVSCEWLSQRLLGPTSSGLRLLDATWFLPNSPFACPVAGSTAEAEYSKGPRLPGARFFDTDAVADQTSSLPHMLPSSGVFAKALARLGISRKHDVVIYDQHGIFSAPRAWYTLKAFGHPSVAVLDGGLPLWMKEGREVETGPADANLSQAEEEEEWELNEAMVWDIDRVVTNISKREACLLDARPAPRFTGSAAEPRAGMRSGHVPGSLNVPFLALLTEQKTMKSVADLTSVFTKQGLSLPKPGDQPPFLVTSCGSGLTACIVGLALKQMDFPVETSWAVYDGSWSEYGARSDTQIVKDGPDGVEVPVPPIEEVVKDAAPPEDSSSAKKPRSE